MQYCCHVCVISMDLKCAQPGQFITLMSSLYQFSFLCWHNHRASKKQNENAFCAAYITPFCLSLSHFLSPFSLHLCLLSCLYFTHTHILFLLCSGFFPPSLIRSSPSLIFSTSLLLLPPSLFFSLSYLLVDAEVKNECITLSGLLPAWALWCLVVIYFFIHFF